MECKDDFPGKEFTPAYVTTNENLRWVNSVSPKAKNVLTVAGSGDQALFYRLSGVKHIDTFDMSLFANVIQEIKTIALQTLSHAEYVQLLSDLWQTKDIIAVKNMSKIVAKMPTNSLQQICIAEYYGIRPFSRGIFDVKFSFLPTKKEYKKLQKKIKKPFNFIPSDVTELHTKLDTEYDLINLSNVLDDNSGIDQFKVIANLVDHIKIGGHLVYLPQYQATKYKNLKITWAISGKEIAYKDTITKADNRFTKMIVFERTR